MPIKIRLAKSAGFCFGVKRALRIALETASGAKPVSMLGDIVHNEDVIQDIRRAGVKKIARFPKKGNGIFLVRAHGIPRSLLRCAEQRGYEIIDATCPMVKEIHTIARALEKEGRTVVIIGDREHDEVRGIVGQLKRPAIVIETPDRVPALRLKKVKKAGVVVQSTQNLDKVAKILETIQPLVRDLKFHNTICGPTRAKQREIKTLPFKNDCMIIIGSKGSANTRRLYEISKGLNKKSHWVRAAGDLRKEWFRGVRSIGVTAGASTPDATTQEVIRRIRTLAS